MISLDISQLSDIIYSKMIWLLMLTNKGTIEKNIVLHIYTKYYERNQ